MYIEEMTMQEVETRISAIAGEIATADADQLTALENELTQLEERRLALRRERMTSAANAAAVRNGAGTPVAGSPEETRSIVPNPLEVRNSPAYINAFANYIKTGSDRECRALLTTNVEDGQVPVPEIVEGYIRTAWERNDLTQLVRRVSVRGNLKIGFELSATGASVHIEGSEAPDEEVITLGTVLIVPESLKKWITISDEAMDMGGEEFLAYIYDEITYRIAQLASQKILDLIVAAPETSTANAVGQPLLAMDPAMGTVATALSLLSDTASNPVVIMNRRTYAQFKVAQAANNYAYDPFEGLTVLYNNSLPAFSGDLEEDDVYMIVGDLYQGVVANFPRGNTITVKRDDLSLAEMDLVKFVGRQYVGLGIVTPNALVRVAPAAAVDGGE